MRVLIVDDHPVVREMICKLLLREPDVEIVGKAGTAQEALENTVLLCPDLVLLDLSLPDIGGLDVIPEIKKACPSTRILLLSEHAAGQIVQKALSTGAVGYVVKSDASKELATAIRVVTRGEIYLCHRLASAAPNRNLPFS